MRTVSRGWATKKPSTARRSYAGARHDNRASRLSERSSAAAWAVTALRYCTRGNLCDCDGGDCADYGDTQCEARGNKCGPERGCNLRSGREGRGAAAR